VIATARGAARTPLHDLVHPAKGRLEIESLDIAMPDQIAALRARLTGRKLDLLFVNAGVIDQPQKTIGEVSTEDFIRIMTTNALGPLRVINVLQHLLSQRDPINIGWPHRRGAAPLASLLSAPLAHHARTMEKMH
jgi:NAD(P)-dependent dehydrogenase (short-subunit alcohol dehydrogenase family)